LAIFETGVFEREYPFNSLMSVGVQTLYDRFLAFFAIVNTQRELLEEAHIADFDLNV